MAIASATIAGDNVINATEAASALTLSGTATAGATVTVTLTNTTKGSAAVSFGTATATGGNWSITKTLSATEIATLGGDAQNLLITATQSVSGATSSATRNLTIDTVVPSTVPTLGLAGAYTDSSNNAVAASDSGLVGDNLTNVTTPTLKGKADANALVNIYQGAGTTPVATVTADGSGTWIWKVGTALTNGSTTAFKAKQKDAAGNESAVSSTLNVTVDTVVAAPTVPQRFGNARYVMVYRAGDLDLGEVYVYSGGTNVALGKTAIAGAQGSDPNGFSLAYLTDNNTTTNYSFNTSKAIQWVQIDLGQAYDISNIVVMPRSNNLTRANNLVVLTSMNSMGTSGADVTLSTLQASNAWCQLPATMTAAGADTTYLTINNASSSLNAQPVFSGTGEVGATVELFDTASVTASNTTGSLGTTKVKADGTWSFQATGIVSGPHSITVKQTDAAGSPL